MSARRTFVTSIGLATMLAACGGSPPPPAQAPKPPVAFAPQPAGPAPSPAATTPPAQAAAPPIASPQPAGPAPSPGATTPSGEQALPDRLGPEVPKYEAKDRRDPFETLEVKEGVRSPIASARLTGIVRSARSTLALVETPEGFGYVMKPGDTLGDGRLLEIGSDSVVFQVLGAPTNRVVLKLATN